MAVQMANAGPAGAMSVASADSAPPAASAMGVPPAAPEPMKAPTMPSTADKATVNCLTVSVFMRAACSGGGGSATASLWWVGDSQAVDLRKTGEGVRLRLGWRHDVEHLDSTHQE